MENKEFTLKINDEKLFNYLQRLGFDIDSRLAVIDRMFTTHKNDQDASVFESVPFKKYSKELEELQAEYTMAKDEFSKILLPIELEKLGANDVTFDWRIDNFADKEVIITVTDITGNNEEK